MADQKTINGKQARSPVANVGRNLAGLAEDLVTLAELQCRLTACDVREAATRSVWPIGLIVGGGILVLGAVPVLLMGLAWALVETTGVTMSVALSSVGAAAIVLAAIGIGWSLGRLKQVLDVFERSRCELLHNVDWIKKVFLQQARRDQDRFHCS